MENKVREITKEDLNRYRRNNLTVGQLREFLYKCNLPDDALVLTQRVEDCYYENNNWGVYKKEGYHYHSALRHNANVENKEEYPDLLPCDKFTEEDLDRMKEQYTPAFCVLTYQDDSDALYINLHY